MEVKICLVLMLINLGTFTVQGRSQSQPPNVGVLSVSFDPFLTTVCYYKFL